MDERQARLSQAKGDYKTALRNLETISDEIHERRRNSTEGPRERGVGAEGDCVSGDDITGFKMETDEISSEFRTLLLLSAHIFRKGLTCLLSHSGARLPPPETDEISVEGLLQPD